MSEHDENRKASEQPRRWTHYDVLDLDRDATEEEIKAAYRRLAREYHPDVATEDPEVGQRFALISQAYRVLSDAQRRRQYDRTLPQKSYPLRHPTPEKIWREATEVVLLRSDRFGPLNQAMQAAIPITLDEDILVLSMPGSERHLSGHMDTAANRNSIVNALELVTGSRVDFRLIDGSSVEDWQRLKEVEKKAREGVRARNTTRASAGSAPARPTVRIGEGPWDEVIQRIHRQYQQVPKRQFPQAKARYLREALSWIAATDEELRYQDDFDEDNHERALARALERLASVLDLPAIFVALQLENMKRAGEL
ncbi:MAG: J domain-containing protein [Armatimonadetes bacterium]|nr:J domain-containing protein [Armatimonadota bacterium]